MPIPMLTSFFIFLTSIVFPMFGQGGGVVYVPLLCFAGFAFYSSVAISQSLIFVSSLSAVITYHRAGMISWPLFLLVEVPTMVGSFVGGRISPMVPVGVAKSLFVVFVFISGWKMFWGKNYDYDMDERREFFFSSYLRGNLGCLGLGVVGMFVAGMFAGLLGVGGGVIKVPVMILFMKIPPRIAVGTSGLMVGLTAVSGFLGHVQSGHFPPLDRVWPYWILVFVGAQIGARTSKRLSPHHYRRYLGLLLIILSILSLLNFLFSNKI